VLSSPLLSALVETNLKRAILKIGLSHDQSSFDFNMVYLVLQA
jgi:hypothetical protein